MYYLAIVEAVERQPGLSSGSDEGAGKASTMMNGMMACCSEVGGIAGMVLANLLGVALLLALVLGAAWWARRPRTSGSGESNEALDIVRREYASGRINSDEYLERSGYLASSTS